MEQVTQDPTIKVVDVNPIVITAQDQVDKPLKCGHCLFDLFQNKNQKSVQVMQKATLIYSKHLRHLHIQAGQPSEDIRLQSKEYQELITSRDTKYYDVFLEHCVTCSNRVYKRLCEDERRPVKYSDKNFRLAVCMTIKDAENNLLLTRRSKHVRHFPHAWVMPGGQIEAGESLEEGVIREIFEETGIKIQQLINKEGEFQYFYHGKQCFMKPYYGFESALSNAFDIKPPSNCQLILFFQVQLSQRASDIQLTFTTDEIDAAAWISSDNIKKILNFQEGEVEGLKISSGDGDRTKKMFKLSQLFPTFPNNNLQGIGRTHHYAIKFMQKFYWQNQAKL